MRVDLFLSPDAAGVTRLFQAVYGDGRYPIKTFLIPERLIEENAAAGVIPGCPHP